MIGVLVRLPILSAENFFNSFYLGHHQTASGSAQSYANVLLTCAKKELGVDKAKLWSTLVGLVGDGAVVYNIPIAASIASKLNLDVEYCKQMCLWDGAHRRELAVSNAKGKVV